MVTIRAKTLFLCVCFFEALWLLVAQTLNSMLLLVPCLVCFLALTVWAAVQNVAMPVLLFFLPFSPLLKIAPGTISFYTVALIAVYVIYVVTSSRNVRVHHLIPGLCLIAMTLAVKAVSGHAVNNSYILFCIALLLVPYLGKELNEKYDFYWLMMFFSLGIALAALTAQWLVVFPTITRYININDALGMIRRSGYFGDPNYYSAHITAALSGLLLLTLTNEKKGRIVMVVLMAILLIYCGLISVSKSFVLVGLCLILFWILNLLFKRGKVSVKVATVLTLAVILIFFLFSAVFSDLLDLVFSRFSQATNLSDLTTGRTELWASYFRAFSEDPWLFLFGSGYTDITVNGRASHNTIIQGIFQFGLLGCILLLAWLACVVRVLLDGVRVRWSHAAQIGMVLMGVFGPWMALDYLFFDEFFLFPIYACAAIRYLSDQTEPEKTSAIEGVRIDS